MPNKTVKYKKYPFQPLEVCCHHHHTGKIELHLLLFENTHKHVVIFDRTVKLIRYVDSRDYFVMACEFIYMIFVAYYIVEEVNIQNLAHMHYK